jgi:PhzF family phenazine biosynthesis protein
MSASFEHCSKEPVLNLEAHIVNAFAQDLACGNPAGVVVLAEEIDDALMLALAADLGKSETAYVLRSAVSEDFGIRWFSPLREMPLCGHATLAAAKVLFETGLAHGGITFKHGAGTIAVTETSDGSMGMSFPLDAYRSEPLLPAYLDFFGLTAVRDCIVGERTRKLVLIVDESVNLRTIEPDFKSMKSFDGPCRHGIGISKAGSHSDFETRYFNPWAGVDEDPVTGSVHTLLASYWSEKLGKLELKAYQNSQRPGSIAISVSNPTVELRGKARIVFSGSIQI